MSLTIMLMLIGLLLVAIVSSAINSNLSEGNSKKIKRSVAIALSKVLSDVAIGLIIAAIPTVILLNHLKPQPENIMPVFIYDGTYAEISDNIDYSLAESLIAECTTAIEQSLNAEKYFDRAFLYFKTDNLDLAKADLQNCIELEENWMYYYDIGVIYGYLLDYPSAIQSFETALSVGIPISERGLVISTLTMIEGYLGEWMYSLLK